MDYADGPPIASSLHASSRRFWRGCASGMLILDPRWLAEHLAKEGLAVSRETLRKWMSKAGLLAPAPTQRVKRSTCGASEGASFGELVMQDSSPFRWLEERGPACQLIALIDDATSRVWARFKPNTTPRKRTCEPWGDGLRTLRASAGPLHR